MSRHTIDPINLNYSVVVGYDNPYRSFFANVHDKGIEAQLDNDPELDADPIIIRLGDRYDAIKTVAELKEKLADYAIISPETQQLLQADLEASAYYSATPLQKSMELLSKKVFG